MMHKLRLRLFLGKFVIYKICLLHKNTAGLIFVYILQLSEGFIAAAAFDEFKYSTQSKYTAI